MPMIDLAGLFYFCYSLFSSSETYKNISTCHYSYSLSSVIHSMKINHLKLPCVMIANAPLRRVGFAADILLSNYKFPAKSFMDDRKRIRPS